VHYSNSNNALGDDGTAPKWGGGDGCTPGTTLLANRHHPA